jgi:hypothetical protein
MLNKEVMRFWIGLNRLTVVSSSLDFVEMVKKIGSQNNKEFEQVST